MQLIKDAGTCMLWLFCSSTKAAPINTQYYSFHLLHRENKSPKTIQVDEDSALARNWHDTCPLL